MENIVRKERKRNKMSRRVCVADKHVEKKKGRGKEEQRQKEGRMELAAACTRSRDLPSFTMRNDTPLKR